MQAAPSGISFGAKRHHPRPRLAEERVLQTTAAQKRDAARRQGRGRRRGRREEPLRCGAEAREGNELERCAEKHVQRLVLAAEAHGPGVPEGRERVLARVERPHLLGESAEPPAGEPPAPGLRVGGRAPRPQTCAQPGQLRSGQLSLLTLLFWRGCRPRRRPLGRVGRRRPSAVARPPGLDQGGLGQGGDAAEPDLGRLPGRVRQRDPVGPKHVRHRRPHRRRVRVEGEHIVKGSDDPILWKSLQVLGHRRRLSHRKRVCEPPLGVVFSKLREGAAELGQGRGAAPLRLLEEGRGVGREQSLFGSPVRVVQHVHREGIPRLAEKVVSEEGVAGAVGEHPDGEVRVDLDQLLLLVRGVLPEGLVPLGAHEPPPVGEEELPVLEQGLEQHHHL
mmetsp:Transcript_68682/g.155363  ORF Transcript_68682/g.155363 Transcript_68682/m.155363 type:complete len:391 (-) Transcript_68682:1343-2515(-)